MVDGLLAAEDSGNGLRMLQRIQHARFVEGQHIARPEVLVALAAELGIPKFDSAYQHWAGPKTMGHIDASRALLHKVGGQGFPTFVLESDGGLRVLDHASYLGRVEPWRGH